MTDLIPAHSPWGPSASEGWATCLDYINANRGLPDYTIEAAAEGTFAHRIRDFCLQHDMDAGLFVGTRGKVEGYEFEWKEDDADLLQHGIDRIRREADGRTLYGEQRVDISKWTLPGQFGTLDAGWYDDEWICIDDLKFGRGVPVSAVRSKQLQLYALGFWDGVARHHTKATKFRLSIDQPRHAGGGGLWETTLDELLEFGDWIKERARLTTLPNPPRAASIKGCMWCRRKMAPGGCDTHEQFLLSMFDLDDLDDLDLAIALDLPMSLDSIMTPERRAYLLQHRSMIDRWLDHHEESAVREGLAVGPQAGMKVVGGNKGRDTFPDKKATETFLVPRLGDKSFTKQLITPKKALEQLSPEDQQKLQPLIKKGVRKPTLVPVEDAREAIVPTSELDDLD